MSQETPAKDSSPIANLLQKTHAKMTLLQRVEEQYSSLTVQRRTLQDELRTLQTEINSEMNRLIEPKASETSFSVDPESSSKREGRPSVRLQSIAA